MNRAPAIYSPEQDVKTGAGCEPAHFSQITQLIPANSPWRLAQSPPVRTDSHERGAASAAGRISNEEGPGLGALTGQGLKTTVGDIQRVVSCCENHPCYCFAGETMVGTSSIGCQGPMT